MSILKDLGFINRGGIISSPDSDSLCGKTVYDIIDTLPLSLDVENSGYISNVDFLPFTLSRSINDDICKKYEVTLYNYSHPTVTLNESLINGISNDLTNLTDYIVNAGNSDFNINLTFSDYTLLNSVNISSSNLSNMLPKTWEIYDDDTNELLSSGISSIQSGNMAITPGYIGAINFRIVIKNDWYGSYNDGDYVIGSIGVDYTGYVGINVNGSLIEPTRVEENSISYIKILNNRVFEFDKFGICDVDYKLFTEYVPISSLSEDVDGQIVIDGDSLSFIPMIDDTSLTIQNFSDHTDYELVSGVDFSGNQLFEFDLKINNILDTENVLFYCYGYSGTNTTVIYAGFYSAGELWVHLHDYRTNTGFPIANNVVFEENIDYNLKFAFVDGTVYLFVNDILEGTSSTSQWDGWDNNEELRLAGYSGGTDWEVSDFTMSNISINKDVLLVNSSTITQEVWQSNWRQYQVTANNPSGDIYLNNILQEFESSLENGVTIKKIEKYSFAFVILLSDGTLRCVGGNTYNTLFIDSGNQFSYFDPGLTGVENIWCGMYYYVFVKFNDGSIKCMGYNTRGCLGIGNTTAQLTLVDSGLSDVKDLYPGYLSTAVVFNDGSVKCVGSNYTYAIQNSSDEIFSDWVDFGISDVKDFKMIYGSSIALLNDGTVKVRGRNSIGQIGLTDGVSDQLNWVDLGVTGVKRIINDSSYSLFLIFEDGTIKCSGQNSYGQLGLGHTNHIIGLIDFDPVGIDVSMIEDITVVYQGTVYLLMKDGSVYGSGYNVDGQLGLGHSDNISEFTKLPVSNITKIITNYKSVIMIDNINRFFSAGSNSNGQLGVGGIANDSIFHLFTPNISFDTQIKYTAQYVDTNELTVSVDGNVDNISVDLWVKE